MNLIDALKTGKRIRRAGDTVYFAPIGMFDPDEIVADDWEVEKEVTITEEFFMNAWMSVAERLYPNVPSMHELYAYKVIEALKKELGL